MTLGAKIKSLDSKDQSGIFFCLSLAAFTEHVIEDDFVLIIEDIVGKPCADAERRSILSELAAAMIASCNFSNHNSLAELYGRDPDILRGITVMLILADSNDPKKARQKTSYSRNRDEARFQVISEVMRILKVKDKKKAAQMNGIEFAKKWNECSAALIPGVLIGMKGMTHHEMVAATLRRIGFLAPVGNAILQEYIKIITPGN